MTPVVNMTLKYTQNKPLSIDRAMLILTMSRNWSKDELTCLKNVNENHRQEAQKSHKYHVEVTTHCTSEWKEIQELEENASLNDDKKSAGLKNKFNLVLCADYQMCKLVPYWSMNAQPGSMYYLQMLKYGGAEEYKPHNLVSDTDYLISKLPPWIIRKVA